MNTQKIIDCHTHVYDKTTYNQYLSKLNTEAILCFKFFRGFAYSMFDNAVDSFDDFINTTPNVYSVEVIDVENPILPQLEIIKNNIRTYKKIKALKIYCGYQKVYPFDEILDPVYEFCIEFSLPVIYHSGALFEYPKSTAQLKYSHPLHVDEVAIKYPNLKFVISHFGFPYMMDVATIVSKNPNVYTDISGIFENDCLDIMQEYVADLNKILIYYPNVLDRLMFGTDFISNETSLNQISPYVKVVKQISPVNMQEKIFYETAKNLYKL